MLPLKKKQNQSPKKKLKQERETKINYLEIIKRALNITFKNKFLWIFGIFIALTSGGSGGGNFGGNFGGGNTEEYFKGWKEKLGIGSGEEIVQIVKNFLESHWIIIVSIGIILFLFAITLNVFAIISRGAIINGINKLDSKIKFRYLLNSGDLLYMKNEIQAQWMHAIPKDPDVGERISLTFRLIIK